MSGCPASRPPRTAPRVLALALAAAACARQPEPPPRDAVQEAFRQDTLSAVEAQGRRLFGQRCATCHGPEGRGDGQNAYNLDPAPPDFRDSLARLTSEGRRRILEGGTAAVGRSPLCPPWGRSLSAEEKDALHAWLDRVARAAAPVAQAAR